MLLLVVSSELTLTVDGQVWPSRVVGVVRLLGESKVLLCREASSECPAWSNGIQGDEVGR